MMCGYADMRMRVVANEDEATHSGTIDECAGRVDS